MSRVPATGKCGRVVLLFEDNPLSKIGVKFDKSIPEGVDLGGLCGEGYGLFCHGNTLYLNVPCFFGRNFTAFLTPIPFSY